MRFLRSKSRSETAEAAQSEQSTAAATDDGVSTAASDVAQARGYTPSKGRPTPRRRDVEGRRRGPAPPPPKTQREALKRSRSNKEDRKKAAAYRRERMAAGDEAYLLPRDRGPVKAYVRDLVDSRRNIMGMFMPLAIVVLVVMFIPAPAIQQYATLLVTAMLLTMIVEGILLGRLVVKRVRAKFPDATERSLSLGFYAFTRATQVRRMRMPKPRVGYGAQL